MGKTPREYAREYYYAHREQILEKQKAYQKAKRAATKRGRPGRKPKQKVLAPVVTETTSFDLRFQNMVQNISEMYNSLLKAHTDLQEAYTNMKAMLKQKDEHYQAIIDKLTKKMEEQEEWKTKIRKFFNLQ
jgi:hypothetical protein